MITNDEEYKQAMLKLANITPTCVDTPEEDMVNELIEEIRQYEFLNFKFHPEDDGGTFGGEING
jgi:predicted TIM-barrel fold metal-dependent hydrolase